MPRNRQSASDSSERQRVLRDTLLPPLTGLLLGGAVGSVLAAVRVAEADLVLLIGGGAVIGTLGGVMLAASRGLRLRPPSGTGPPR